MKYASMNSIGNDNQIEIISDGLCWDLHNAADFLGHDYNDYSRILSLHWDYGSDIENSISGKIKIEFTGISELEIKNKDPEMPRDEDKCLDEMHTEDNKIFCISFRGGQRFKFVLRCCSILSK